MKFRIEINQKEIIEAGIKGLKIQEWLLFDVVRHMIGADWTKKITEDEKSYAWVSEQSILDQIPLLELSKRQVHRLVDNLVEAGLIVRFAGNKGAKRVYLGLTTLGDSLGRHSLTNMAISNGSECQKRQSENDKSGNLSMTEMSEDNKIKNNLINNNSTDPDSQANGKPFPIKKPKATGKRISYEDSCRFYADQLNALMPSAKEGSPAPPPDVQGYGRMAEWMKTGDVEIPNGMRDTVMRMGEQLSFPQVQKILGDMNLTWYQIKHYLVRLHGYTENKNTSVYLTIKKWYSDDVLSNKVPPRNAPTNGVPSSPSKLSAPKEVHQ